MTATKTKEKEYDFYFSEKHIKHMSQLMYQEDEKPIPVYFKGQRYTEMIEKGKTPGTNWQGDLIFLGTGIEKDISWERS